MNLGSGDVTESDITGALFGSGINLSAAGVDPSDVANVVNGAALVCRFQGSMPTMRPAPLVVLFAYLWWEPEPKRLLLLAFGWGSSV